MLLSQTANQPSKWLQPNAFMHVDVAKNTLWQGSKQTSERKTKWI